MILLGCLLAFGLAIAPRVFLVLAWIFSDRWRVVWQGELLVPLLGIIFLPYTTIMYMLVWTPTGIQGWDWLWILLGVLLDIWKWQQIIQNRRQATETGMQYYSSATGGGQASSSQGGSASSAAAPAAAAPAAAAPASMPALAPADAGSETKPEESPPPG
jgi:hypothetical protein